MGLPVNPLTAHGLRLARLEDCPAIDQIIATSARALGSSDYTPAQIEAALGSAWGLDTQLIRDGTYFVIEADGQIIACGGWSRRKTRFGADAMQGREPALLDPRNDAARIRAFFVHPDWARRGLATLLLERCEQAAIAEGFRSFELVATLPGSRFYPKFGFREVERLQHNLARDVTIDFIVMKKAAASPIPEMSGS